MVPELLAQLKILLAGLATVALSVTPAVQQTIQTNTNSNSTAPNIGSNGNSRNWSGYVSTGSSYTSISGTWTIPQVTTSGHTATDATWVGIGGVSSNDLIQSGTQNIVDPSGQVSTTAFYELLPDSSISITSVSVKPGDSVTVTISEQASNQWLINFNDNTTNQNYQTTVTYDSSTSSAEWIEEAPSNGVSVLPLDNFGTIQFSNGSTTQNGTKVSTSSSNTHAVTMVNNSGQALATPSGLGSDGASFTITRSNAVSNTPIPGYDTNPGSFRRRGRGIGSYSFYPRRYHYQTPPDQPTTAVSPAPTISPEPSAQPVTIRVFQFRHGGRFGFRRF
jgi:peptidase A4-like protein